MTANNYTTKTTLLSPFPLYLSMMCIHYDFTSHIPQHLDTQFMGVRNGWKGKVSSRMDLLCVQGTEREGEKRGSRSNYGMFKEEGMICVEMGSMIIPVQ